jgi:hypothetical protein
MPMLAKAWIEPATASMVLVGETRLDATHQRHIFHGLELLFTCTCQDRNQDDTLLLIALC